MRDLCRARADLVADRTRARHRLSKFLLRHGRVWRGGATAWTETHERWLASQRFDDPSPDRHLRATTGPCWRSATPSWRRSRPTWPVWYGPATVRRPGGPAGRLPRGDPPGRAHLGQRGRRLAPVRPGERRSWGSAGWSQANTPAATPTRRGHITKSRQRPSAHPAGRVGLGLPAPAQCRGPRAARAASQGLDPEVGRPGLDGPAAPVRPLPRLAARKNAKTVVVTAIARELAGFLWAEMTAA